MTCSEGRWTCPDCRVTELRPTGTSLEHWQVRLREQQEFHGAFHSQRRLNSPVG